MAQRPEAAIAALLREAESAHGAYEATVLGGDFDADWPRWYAAFLLERGLARHLPDGCEDVERLAATLKVLADDYERERPVEAWPDTYAHRLAQGPQ